MPRNPDKIRCQIPACRSWAMRGHTRCRAHRDAQLGPRGAGAPHGNLNALQHGRHSHPLPPLDLQNLARQIVQQPDDLPLHISLLVQSLHNRAGDPFKALLALYSLLPQLTPQVAHHLFTAELDALLQDLPPPYRHPFRVTIEGCASHLSPENKLALLRKIKKSTEQLTELGPKNPVMSGSTL